MKLKTEHIIIIALVGFLIFMQQCGGKLNLVNKGVRTQTIIETVSDTVTTVQSDTVVVEKERLVPVTVYRDITRIDTIIYNLPPEGELEALRDYFSRKVYLDTLLGENYSVVISDTLEQNSILARTYFANVETKTITNEVTIYPPTRFKFFVGGGLTYNVDSKFDFTPTIGFIPRNDMYFYSVGYNVLNRGITASVMFKLKFK